MEPQKIEPFLDPTDDARRSVHDVAAAMISVRALAETLAEHVPTLVAMSRSKNAATRPHIPPITLDSLPSIPTEIIKLCEIARDALQELGNGSRLEANPSSGPARGYARSKDKLDDGSNEPVSFNGTKVLLVDDDEQLRYLLVQTLRAQGCRVTSSSYGEDALRLFDKTDFDLILMDLRLPGVSGWETTKRMRQKTATKGRNTRIVGLTASPMLQDHARAKAAGMDEVLVKPVNEKALQSVLKQLA